MNKVLIIAFLLLSSIASTYAHRKIEIDTVKNTTGGYSFYCTNEDTCSYVIRMFVTQFDNLSTAVELPFTARILPGKQRLFDVRIINKDLPINLKYYFVSLDGSYKQPLSVNYPYLLPFKAGKEAKAVVEKHTISQFMFYEAYSDMNPYYRIEVGAGQINKSFKYTPQIVSHTKFILHYGDTIYAARKGLVSVLIKSTVKDNNIDTLQANINELELYQGDCSFATYKGLHNVLVKKDEWVNAGDPIALAGESSTKENAVLLFDVCYYDFDTHKDYGTGYIPVSFYLSYHTPLFYTEEGEKTKLENNKTYTSIHSEAIITKEMSKREFKKWKKKHP